MKTNIERMEEKFNLAESLVNQLDDLVGDFTTNYVIIPTETHLPSTISDTPSELFSLNDLRMDFDLVKNSIIKLINRGHQFLDTVSVIDASDLTATQIKAIAEVQTALGNNISRLIDLYEKIANIEKTKRTSSEKKEAPNVQGNVTQNNTYVFKGSSADLLKNIIENQSKIIDV